MAENANKQCNQHGISLQILQTAYVVQYFLKSQKMSRRPKQEFLQRRHTDGQPTHEKTLNITNC